MGEKLPIVMAVCPKANACEKRNRINMVFRQRVDLRLYMIQEVEMDPRKNR